MRVFFQHTGTEIVRDCQPGYAAEILIGMYMAEQPVFRFHVTAEFGINIATTGKNPYKKVCRNSLSSNRIFDWQCPACPVHFHSIPGLMMDPHCGFGFFRPCPVNVTKLCILVWDTPGIGAIDLIFFPKQCQVHSFFRQFTVNPGTVRFQINICFFLSFRIKQDIKLWIVTSSPSGHRMPFSSASRSTSLRCCGSCAAIRRSE